LAHMKKSYANLKAAQIGGLMFDYAWSGWSNGGGMDDPYTTAGACYRMVFRLAAEGLGPECWIHERCLEFGSDVTLGLVASQRTMWDNNRLTANMVSTGGLRWYKNRVVMNYDNDAKNLLGDDRDAVRRILTMSYVTSGRLLLSNSFGSFSKHGVYDLTRIYPFPTKPKSARPIDAFISDTPRIYDYQVTDQWHQVTLYNDDNNNARGFSVPLAKDNMAGGLALEAKADYYAFDFWNDRFAGKFAGTAALKQTLRPREARMLSLHQVQNHPQFLATNRHIMQGVLDMPAGASWNAKTRTLSGVSTVVEGDPYIVILANNGRQTVSCNTNSSTAKAVLSIKDQKNGLTALTITSGKSETLTWSVKFK